MASAGKGSGDRSTLIACAILVLLSGCQAVGASAHRAPGLDRAAGADQGHASQPVASRFRAPPGVLLEMTCTPSGVETCYDATDNNCNGIIDEGCGVRTGPLQFAIAWYDASDVDLEVIDPKGKKAELERRPGQALIKDRDCGGLRDTCHGQNMENVVYSGDRPGAGAYVVLIRLEAPAEHVRYPLTVRFGSRVGARTFGASLDFMTPKEEKVFDVLVDADGL